MLYVLAVITDKSSFISQGFEVTTKYLSKCLDIIKNAEKRAIPVHPPSHKMRVALSLPRRKSRF